MKRGIIRYLVLCLFVGTGISEVQAQDPHYTQFYANQPLLNPAFTGAALGPRVSLGYRAQWVSIPGSFRQVAASYDQPIGNSAHGLGVTLHNDRAGEGNLQKTFINANYSFAIQFGSRRNPQYVRLGLGGGVEQASIDFAKLRFGDQIDPREGFINATQEVPPPQGSIRPDVHTGIVYYNQYAWLSASAHHLNEPTQSLSGAARGPENTLPRRYTFTGGVRIPLGPPNDPESISVSPAFLFMQQRNFNQLNLGTYVNMDPMVFGVWYRTNYNNFRGDFIASDAVAGLIGFKEGIFSIGYSYDYTVSRLSNGLSGGSHEIQIVMEFERNKPKTFKHRSLPCPRF